MEQPTSVSQIPNNNIIQKDHHMVLKKLIQEMERGKKSTEIIRSLICQNTIIKVEDNVNNNNNNVADQDCYYQALLDHHLKATLEANINSLSMLKSCEFDGSFIKKRKLDHENDSLLFDDQYESQERCIKRTGRGCYKRSKTGESRVEEVSDVTDDGFAWRKYGQKIIQDANHPRNYYRCTHKHDQKCEATKQVQQISENPTKYKIIYHGYHKCNNNFLKTSQFISDDTQQQNSSAFLLSFDQPNLFPASAFPATSFWKQEQNTSTEEVSSVSYESYNNTVQNNCSVECSDNISNTPQDLTATTDGQSSSNFISDHYFEENYASTASSFNFVEDYSYMFDDLSDVLQDW